jgi:hypothetical protein
MKTEDKTYFFEREHLKHQPNFVVESKTMLHNILKLLFSCVSVFCFCLLVLYALALHDVKKDTENILDPTASISFNSYNGRYFLFSIEGDSQLSLAYWCIVPWRKVDVSK